MKITDLNSLMEQKQKERKIWKLVLTGGPCGGKTTGQARLSTFFENLGWKVFRVPETANVLLSGGVNFAELSEKAAVRFQENLLRTMIQIENSFFDLGKESRRNCLIICDRGAMDASAFITRDQWETILDANGMDEIEIRDHRYDQIVHLVSAAKGAEQFYSLDHTSRSEGLELARERDTGAAEAWVGHPYVDIIDNSSDFESKINRLISVVAYRMGIDIGDRLREGAKKVKMVINGPLPPDSEFPSFRDFTVTHHYLRTTSRSVQSRIRKRGVNGKWSYTSTIRKHLNGQNIEVKSPLTARDYLNLTSQSDDSHYVVNKIRRCFVYNNQYFQLDIYKEPSHQRCKGLMLLETYTTQEEESLIKRLPPFLNIGANVTGDPAFSMFNLSLKEEWHDTKRFCHRLTDDENEENDKDTKEAEHRYATIKSRQPSLNGSSLSNDSS